MKYSLFILLFLIFSCKQQNQGSTETIKSSDPCEKYTRTLNGVFAAPYMEGTMTWSGGLEGTVDIEGVDYNDIVCQYRIADCLNGTINMVCNESGYDTRLEIITQDSIRLDNIGYSRVQ